MMQFAAMPAERRRGAVLVDDFYSGDTVARNGWTLTGAPSFSAGGGLILNGSTQYATRPLTGELNSANQTWHIEFTPTFAANDGANRQIIDTDAAGRTIVYKASTNNLIIYVGGTTKVADVALGSYSAYWVQNGRNLLSISVTSGANQAYLNGNLISSTGTAWTYKNPTTLYVGSSNGGASLFPGTISRLYIGHHTSTLAEHTAYYNNTMFDWRNRAIVDLQFRTADYDAGNSRILDTSGNGNNAAFTGGAPTQKIGYTYFTTSQYLTTTVSPNSAGTYLMTFDSPAASSFLCGSTIGGGAPRAYLTADANGIICGGVADRNFTSIVGSTKVTDGAVHTAALSWDGTTVALYCDGALEYTAAQVGTVGGGDPILVGKVPAGGICGGNFHDFKFIQGEALNPTQVLDYNDTMKKRIGREV